MPKWTPSLHPRGKGGKFAKKGGGLTPRGSRREKIGNAAAGFVISRSNTRRAKVGNKIGLGIRAGAAKAAARTARNEHTRAVRYADVAVRARPGSRRQADAARRAIVSHNNAVTLEFHAKRLGTRRR